VVFSTGAGFHATHCVPPWVQVFIEDGEEVPPRLLSTSDAFPASFSGRTEESQDPWKAGIARRQAHEESPPWWSPPATIYIDPAYKGQVTPPLHPRWEEVKGRVHLISLMWLE